ncbi:MAG: HD domain-containing protein [Bacilli bacterium]|nr:HD domain-containing protein [Bacilli bacterium]
MDKIQLLNTEIKEIKDIRLRENLEIIVSNLPDYFFLEPASSTGKYHPSFSLGEGGLLRHSKVAFRIGLELLNTSTFSEDFTPLERDLLLMSILVHDGLKKGKTEEKYVRFDHPILMANYLDELKDKLSLSKNELDFMKDVISSHMGEWNTNSYSKVVLPLPKTKYQKFVHLCDLLSSKKFLDVKFKDNEIIDRED